MNKDIFTYLRSYSVDPQKINRLIVSAFLYSLKIEKTENEFLQPFLIKIEDDEYFKLKDFLAIHQFSEIEELIEVFEFVISPEEKVVTGAVYTPKHIREYIVKQCFAGIEDFENLKICDPACGCSGFLYTAAQLIKQKTNLTYREIFERNIFGLDIQEFSITRSKLLLTLFAISEGETADFSYNLFHGNALNFNWSNTLQNHEGFDIIVGNPPYVCSRNIDKESKALLTNWSVCSTGHPDLYIPFFELGISNLKEGGLLGYITMNTFFKSINGRALREYLSQFDNSIIDFGDCQVFDSKSTYTCICLIKKNSTNFVQYAKIDSVQSLQEEIEFNEINFELLDNYDGWNLREIEILNRIERVGTPLAKKVKTRNGIATLKNKIYIFNPIDEDENYYYLQNGSVYPIEKEVCSDIVNSNKFTKVECVDTVRQKVIFPYRYVDNRVQLIDEMELSNSYPRAYEYLQDKRSILATRDKGNGKYENWYAYGRKQSLELMQYKLLFPHISSGIPNYVVSNEERLLFYNGLALIADNQTDLIVMKRILGSRLFWFYILNSSKPYGSGYYSLSRNYIKNFGIPDFSEEEVEYLINENDQDLINEFIDNKYGVNTTDLF